MKVGIEFRCQICQTIHWEGSYTQAKKLERPICCGRLTDFTRRTKDFCPSILCKLATNLNCNCICGGRYHSRLSIN